jgi:transcriptional regulator with GAF, ATPase, and Fis domain
MENANLLMVIIHPDDREWFNVRWEEAFLKDSTVDTNVRIISKKGETRWIGIVTQKVVDKEGNSLGLRTSSRDITNVKKTEESLASALAEVESLKGKLEEENRYLREKFQPMRSDYDIVTNSPLMLEVMEQARQVAVTDAPVLLFGETGTGKELIAHAIHNSSKRRQRLMITINCAALPPTLIESELFGREKGAYTGALARQIGRFELANHSTVFLDEIGELPLEIQVKLLRVIQFGEFQMLGSPETKKVDVRIIAATNRDLSKAIADGVFRNDLYYRLNVFPINVPSLRERKEDIPVLAWTFVDEIAAKMGKHIVRISSHSMSALLRYSWPGNVRELRNLIEYSIIVAHDTTLVIHLPVSEDNETSGETLDDQQRVHIEKVLNQTGWRIRGKDGAAEKLGMKESTLRFRMKKLGIERKK